MKFTLVFFIFLYTYTEGTKLYPWETDRREVLSLDGLWNFYLNGEGTSNNGSITGDVDDKDVFLMPVPSSYNDILTTAQGRDYQGEVTYERKFYIPYDWKDFYIIWLRFGSVTHNAWVYVNGELLSEHHIGHLPFIADITLFAKGDEENTIKVVVDSTLSNTSIPQGVTFPDAGMAFAQNRYLFPFFNYGGIDRSVVLYKTCSGYVDDIVIRTSLDTSDDNIIATIDYEIFTGGSSSAMTISVTIFDQDGNQVYAGNEVPNNGTITLENANLWWPYLMSDSPGYLYTLRVDLILSGDVFDTYDQKFGIRELSWNDQQLLINGKPIYFRGFSRHEDSDFRGKGLDLPVILRDHNLLRWIGANSYRTSNYPYAEEVLDLADELGIMIINESPAVMLSDLTIPELLENHKQALSEQYTRDKNRPSVILWSVAADPAFNATNAENYFREITDHMRDLDSTRPITIPTPNSYVDKAAQQFADIISINKYEGWTTAPGDIDVLTDLILSDIRNWHEAYNKPIMVTEYGAETKEGYHSVPEFVWSEEYQQQFLAQYFKAFDDLRDEGYFIGEMIFNFADFKSDQTILAVGGNRKGIFTRQRQPKSSSFLVRKRYWSLAEEIDNATPPSDLDIYSIKNNKRHSKEEL